MSLCIKVLSESEPPSWPLLRFCLRLRISRSLAWSWLCMGLCLKVLLESEPPSWSLLSFRLRFRINRSQAWSWQCMGLCLKVLSESKLPSWSLLSFHLWFQISRYCYRVWVCVLKSFENTFWCAHKYIFKVCWPLHHWPFKHFLVPSCFQLQNPIHWPDQS